MGRNQFNPRKVITIRATRLSSPPIPLEGEFDSFENEFANAVLAPGFTHIEGPANFNMFHLNEMSLPETVKAIDVVLQGELEACHGCSPSKSLRRLNSAGDSY